MLGAFEGQSINPLGYFEARIVRQDDSTKSAVIKINVSQNAINILGRNGQTKLSVFIEPTKFCTVVWSKIVGLQNTGSHEIYNPQGLDSTFVLLKHPSPGPSGYKFHRSLYFEVKVSMSCIHTIHNDSNWLIGNQFITIFNFNIKICME